MSAELTSLSGPGGNPGSPQGTTVGGTKPLHRFLKGQPKIIGTVVLVLGASFISITIAVLSDYNMHMWTTIPPSILLGTMFIASGILYILTEHNPTKKTVTISLALSIISILGTCWSVLHSVHIFESYHSFRGYELSEGNITDTEAIWGSYYEEMGTTLETVFVFHSFVGGVIFVIMSFFAGAALRSTKHQAIVVMTTAPVESPVE